MAGAAAWAAPTSPTPSTGTRAPPSPSSSAPPTPSRASSTCPAWGAPRTRQVTPINPDPLQLDWVHCCKFERSGSFCVLKYGSCFRRFSYKMLNFFDCVRDLGFNNIDTDKLQSGSVKKPRSRYSQVQSSSKLNFVVSLIYCVI